MKEKDEIIELPPETHKLEFPIGEGVRFFGLIYGKPDTACFRRLRDMVDLLELSMLGTQANKRAMAVAERPRDKLGRLMPSLEAPANERTVKQRTRKRRKKSEEDGVIPDPDLSKQLATMGRASGNGHSVS